MTAPHHEHAHDESATRPGIADRVRSPTLWIFIGFALVGAWFLLTQHPTHVWGYLPYALLLLCPFLHLFGHGGHGGKGRGGGHH